MTGASGVLGNAIAHSLAQRGYTMFFTWNSNEAKATQTLQELRVLSPASQMVRCDVSKPSEIAHAFATFRQHFDRLDLLIASASNFFRTPLPSVTEAEWDSLVDTNLKGTFFTMQEAMRLMQQQPFVSRIITMTDVSAQLVWENFAPYTAAKAAIQHLTKVFAKACAPNILVNSIAPGTVTMNVENAEETQYDIMHKIPLQRAGKPNDIIHALYFLLESNYVTGQTIVVDGGRMLH